MLNNLHQKSATAASEELNILEIMPCGTAILSKPVTRGECHSLDTSSGQWRALCGDHAPHPRLPLVPPCGHWSPIFEVCISSCNIKHYTLYLLQYLCAWHGIWFLQLHLLQLLDDSGRETEIERRRARERDKDRKRGREREGNWKLATDCDSHIISVIINP